MQFAVCSVHMLISEKCCILTAIYLKQCKYRLQTVKPKNNAVCSVHMLFSEKCCILTAIHLKQCKYRFQTVKPKNNAYKAEYVN